MNSNIKTAIFWLVLICVAVLLWTVVRTGNHRTERAVTFTEFLSQVDAGKVKEVTISGNDVHGVYANENAGLHTLVPTRADVGNRRRRHGDGGDGRRQRPEGNRGDAADDRPAHHPPTARSTKRRSARIALLGRSPRASARSAPTE